MQGKNANRWRALDGSFPTVLEHVQDSRYTLHKQGYGPPRQGTLALYYDGDQLLADGLTYSLALATRMAHLDQLRKLKRRPRRLRR